MLSLQRGSLYVSSVSLAVSQKQLLGQTIYGQDCHFGCRIPMFFFFRNLQYPVPRMLRKQFQLNRPCSFREELFINLIIYVLITAILDASTHMFSYILEIISKCFTCKLSSISLAISVKGRLKVLSNMVIAEIMGASSQYFLQA